MTKKSKMKYNISFQERARLAKEALLKQPPVTLKQAREQAESVKNRIAGKIKKRHDDPQQTTTTD
jgi:hypothetical protein